jgi:low temperature requirement protein LtrA
VAIGAGFVGLHIGWGAVTVAILGLCIAYYLWWAYFSGDDERAEHVLDRMTDPLRKARVALQGWGYAHYPMLLGIVFLSAGIKRTVVQPFDPLAWAPAIALGGGTALFLLGHAWFLRILGLRGVVHRVAASAAILATIPLAHMIAVAQLIAVPLIMAIAMIVEDAPAAIRARNTEVHTFGRNA